MVESGGYLQAKNRVKMVGKFLHFCFASCCCSKMSDTPNSLHLILLKLLLLLLLLANFTPACNPGARSSHDDGLFKRVRISKSDLLHAKGREEACFSSEDTLE